MPSYVNDFFDEATLVIPDGRHGGARRGSGRKAKAKVEAAVSAAADSGVESYDVSRARKEQALADKESVFAKKAALDYEIQSQNFIPRESVIRATATAYATIAQAMRSLPDMMERRLGIDPALAEELGVAVDELLDDLSKTLDGIMPVSDVIAR